jgi:hypothetical protein
MSWELQFIINALLTSGSQGLPSVMVSLLAWASNSSFRALFIRFLFNWYAVYGMLEKTITA